MMMKKYKVTHRHKEGVLEFVFDEQGNLRAFDSTQMEIANVEKFLLEWIPMTMNFEKHKKAGFVIEEIIEVTFENFWNLYDDKRDKTKTKALWDRLSGIRQKQYFDWVKPYFKFLQEKYQGSDWTSFKKMAKSYISKDNAPWEDEVIRKYKKIN